MAILDIQRNAIRTRLVFNADWQEFRVTQKDALGKQVASYFTDDAHDAIGTAAVMAGLPLTDPVITNAFSKY